MAALRAVESILEATTIAPTDTALESAVDVRTETERAFESAVEARVDAEVPMLSAFDPA